MGVRKILKKLGPRPSVVELVLYYIFTEGVCEMGRRKKALLAVVALVCTMALVAGCATTEVPEAPPEQEPVQLLNQEVVAENGIVAAAHPLAAQVGAEILQQGGNAIDA